MKLFNIFAKKSRRKTYEWIILIVDPKKVSLPTVQTCLPKGYPHTVVLCFDAKDAISIIKTGIKVVNK